MGLLSKKGKNKAKITQGGIGRVSNNATVNQTITNEGNVGDILRLPGEIVGGVADVIQEELEDIF
jgi:hypothetical protein